MGDINQNFLITKEQFTTTKILILKADYNPNWKTPLCENWERFVYDLINNCPGKSENMKPQE